MVFSVVHTTESGSTIWRFKTEEAPKKLRSSTFVTVEGFKQFLKDISEGQGLVELLSIQTVEL